MIDIHAHLLPGIDDGSQDMETSVAMAAMAAESGTEAIILTPHGNQRGAYENYGSPPLFFLLHSLRQVVREAGIPLRLYMGMEIFASADVPKLLREKKLLTLAGSRYPLVEFAFDEHPQTMRKLLRELKAEGYTPVVAHPERYFALEDDPDILFDWAADGIELQVNKSSFFGYFGSEARDLALLMLESGIISCVASDAHGTQRRTTELESVRALIESEFGAQEAERLLRLNPLRILQNRPLQKRGGVPI